MTRKKISFINKLNLFYPVIISFIFIFIGQYLMYDNKKLIIGLLFWALGAIFLIFSFFIEKKEIIKEEKIDKRIEFFILFLIILIGIFFRTYMIKDIPAGCYRDEGQNGNEAINIMNGVVLDGTSLPVYIERWTQNAAMYMYFVAASFKFFGIGVLQIRLVSIIFGILCIPAFYFLLRYLYGVRLALIGAFLIATLRWHVNFSRIGFLGILTVFFVILCIYFAWKVYKERKIFDFIMLGIVTALSLYTYLASRLIPVAIFIFGLYILFKDFKFYKNNWKKILIGLAAFFIVGLPLFEYAVKHPQYFTSRQSAVSIFNLEMLREIGGRYVEKDGQPKHWTKLYIENVWRTLMMFNWSGDGNPRHNYALKPMLDFITGIFFVAGFMVILFKIFNPLNFLLFSFFISMIQAGLLSTESPQAYRTIGLIPVVLAISMIGFKVLYHAMEDLLRKNNNKVFTFIVLFLLLISGYENYEKYFTGFANNPGSWAEFSSDEYSMGRYVHSLGDSYIAIIDPAWMNSYTYKFATYPYKNSVEFSPSEWIPIKAKVEKNFVYILDDEYLPLVPVLKSMYPNGKYSDFRHKFHKEKILYFTYEVPYEDVKKQQDKPVKNGLKGHYYYGIEWKDPPVFVRLDPFILFNWTVDPVMGKFSVKWTGKIKIDVPGEYTFITKTNDYSDLFINDKLIIKNKSPGNTPLHPMSAKIYLTKGLHKIVLRYYESIHYSKMQFWWRKPGAMEEEVVPSEVLIPE
ncbi:MAG: PA14 domain-containing protein [Candidatus Goldbacteria bacterium]|nr:PA14 domain-containing protein [Candidatus Goldiibacteriota bacterium]